MRKVLLLSGITFLILSFTACKKDKPIEDAGASLQFSQDSILYDTVFTTIGSTTRYFRVINPYNQKINISQIFLARGASSFYRLNVDGVPGKSFTNIEIPAKDSIYVFVEVTIDPNLSTNPFIYQDSIIFETNGNQQDVKLISFGRNCYVHYPTETIYFSSGGSFSYGVLPCNEVWSNDKPHVVYGFAVVDSACSLTINPGTEVYIHQNGGIWVYRFGTIQVLGTATQPVTFQNDRLEPEYEDIPGQWDRIWIQEGSSNNIINHAKIKNAFIGLQANFSGFDGFSYASSSDPRRLQLYNTSIQNCSGMGLLARYFNIEGGNNCISNCGQYLAVLQYGGSYSFRHCTFANFWTAETRTTPSVYINNYTSVQTLNIDSAYFVNCIIDGLNGEELQLDSANTSNAFKNVVFDHCILKTQLNTSNAAIFKNPKLNTGSSFVNAAGYNFKLNNNSPAINYGLVLPNYTIDITGTLRDANPDLGAYEYTP